jgi:hypothetical protein
VTKAILGDSAGAIRSRAGLGSAGQRNRDYWRWSLEREGAFKVRRERQFV